MGDRAVVRVYSDNDSADPICVYLHWGGYKAAALTAKGLEAARGRWADDSYGTRIVVQELIHELYGEETGGGLFIGEDTWGAEHPIINVRFSSQTVSVELESGTVDRTFEAFISDTELHKSIDDPYGYDE